jgi:Arc/MetJ-type ribon-helix-helix transcriptional regulator
VREIDRLVPSAHASRSDAIRHALELYVGRSAAERDAAIYEKVPLSDDELALADDPEGWARTPKW